jgi:hypothetical protein
MAPTEAISQKLKAFLSRINQPGLLRMQRQASRKNQDSYYFSGGKS